MKIRTILAFANWLEKRPKEQFEQAFYAVKTPCGTAACVAGSFCLWRGMMPVFRTNIFGHWIAIDYRQRGGRCFRASRFAQEGMGLSPEVGAKLFSSDAKHQTPKQAAEALRSLVANFRRKK
ncbi:MAG: hypothetical protein KGL39_13800 [Patescibacteria group bacterium]|nr:hypothetical protein [Patescibacteria group bacterium]